MHYMKFIFNDILYCYSSHCHIDSSCMFAQIRKSKILVHLKDLSYIYMSFYSAKSVEQIQRNAIMVYNKVKHVTYLWIVEICNMNDQFKFKALVTVYVSSCKCLGSELSATLI